MCVHFSFSIFGLFAHPSSNRYLHLLIFLLGKKWECAHVCSCARWLIIIDDQWWSVDSWFIRHPTIVRIPIDLRTIPNNNNLDLGPRNLLVPSTSFICNAHNCKWKIRKNRDDQWWVMMISSSHLSRHSVTFQWGNFVSFGFIYLDSFAFLNFV